MFGRQIGRRWGCFNITTNLNRRCRPSKETQCFAPCSRHVDRFSFRFTAGSDERLGKREMLLISQASGGSRSGGLREGGGWGMRGAEAKMNWMMDKHGERKHTLFLTADERKLKICWNSADTNTSLSSAWITFHPDPARPLSSLPPPPPQIVYLSTYSTSIYFCLKW